MSASQRRKGAGGEREVCALLHGEFGVVAARELSQSRDGGCDVRVRPFAIEVKRRARIGSLYQWMSQAEQAATTQETPVVMCRADGTGWIVCMRFEDWARLAREEIACAGNESPITASPATTGGSPSSASEIAPAIPSTTTSA